MAKKDKWLFTIDLDGTLLKDSKTGEVSNVDKRAIKRLIKEGHVVCIVTGRPWRSTEKVYKELGLTTVVGNYNGAQIHNPTDYNFNQVLSHMNLNDVMYILGDPVLEKWMSNLAIEGPGWVMLQKRDEDLERVFGFKDAAKLRLGINFNKIPLKPTGVVIDTKKGVDILRLKDYLNRRYGDLVEFSSWSKGKDLTPVLDMTNVGITKAKVVSLLARFYDVDIKKTISIGDGYNDVPMFGATEISCAMANASKDIHRKVTYVTKKTNQEGGVAEVIKNFLDKPEWVKEQKILRKKLNDIKDETTAAH